MSENKNTFTTREESASPIQAILVGVVTKDDDAAEVEIGLDELARLLDTAGGEVFARVVQNKSTPDPRTLIGSGKVQELAELCRNHSIGLVVFDCDHSMAIHDLEQRLHQGKLSFASEQRMDKWLGLKPGSVSPFGLINDEQNHVHLFLDSTLKDKPSLSFHPNDNTATVVISQEMFGRYLEAVGNSYEYIDLY